MRYQIRNAKVQFGADTILNSVNFEIHDTEKIAIVGRNGCGKTTLLRLIAGDIEMSNLDSDETCGITMSQPPRHRCSGVVGKLSEKLRKCRYHCIT